NFRAMRAQAKKEAETRAPPKTLGEINPDLDQQLAQSTQYFIRLPGSKLGMDVGTRDGLIGVMVTEVPPESVCQQAGFKIGDLILEAGDQGIAKLEDIRRAVGQANGSILLK